MTYKPLPLTKLLSDVRGCTICAAQLPHGTRPVLQISAQAKILIAGQAPGRKVHESGIPFDDASGNRLREWMGITREQFYNPQLIAILPMGFCFPGTGKNGDLPPRHECAPAWRAQLLDHMKKLELTLLTGQYAIAAELNSKNKTLTESVRNWQTYGPKQMPLPHPSPRNNIWLSKNSWFEKELIPSLQQRVKEILSLDN